MKKAVCIFLVFVLLAGFGVVGALAQTERTLPVVTSIQAQWNGTMLFTSAVNFRVSCETINVTLHFEDGTYQQLDSWTHWNSANEPLWTIRVLHILLVTSTGATESVILYYIDSYLVYDWFGHNDYSIFSSEVLQDHAFTATLPQVSLEMPNIQSFRQQLIAQHSPLQQVVLDQPLTTTGKSVFAFTPTVTGFYAASISGHHTSAILDSNFNLVTFRPTQSTKLYAGQLYYIVVDSSSPGQLTMTRLPFILFWGWGSSSVRSIVHGGGDVRGRGTTMQIYSPTSWTAQADVDWLLINGSTEPVSGSGDASINFRTLSNDSGDERVATITFTTECGYEHVMTIFQRDNAASWDFWPAWLQWILLYIFFGWVWL